MIGVDTKVTDTSKRVIDAAKKANFKNFAHAAATIRKSIIAGIQITKETVGWITTKRRAKRKDGSEGRRIRARIYKPSPPGKPVHSHRNKGFVSRGVRFDATDEGAVIGFAQTQYGDVMAVHEFGGERFGQKFEERPTVLPGLEENIERFAGEWKGSIGA